jgi:hypothetical protein
MTHMPIARQRLVKHIPVKTNTQATIEKPPLLGNGAIFYGSALNNINSTEQNQNQNRWSSLVKQEGFG